MRKNLFEFILIGIIIFPQLLLSDTLPQFNYIPPDFVEYGKSLNVKLDVLEGREQIKEVYLFYKKGNLGYTQKVMILESEMNPYYQAEIPGDFIDQAIEYYFRILLISGEELTLPSGDAENNPYYVNLKISGKEAEKQVFQKLCPTDKYSFTAQEFMVAISYFSIEDEIKDKTVKFYFDGTDVSENATITSNMLVYKPKGTATGIHSIKIAVYNEDGSVYNSQDWTVNVKGEKATKKLPVSVNGDFYVTSRFRSISAEDSSYYYGNGNDWKNFGQLKLYGSKDWFRYNGRMYLSSDEDKSRQPVNKYSLDMYVPHFSLYLGDHNQSFTNTMISGKNVRGYGGTVDFKFFKLHSFYGQIKRNIKGREELVYASDDTTVVDTNIVSGSYKRNCLGLRLQFGNERKFAFGVSAVKVKDDMSSEKFATNPKDNIVVGVDSKLALLRQRLVFGAEVSTSLLNNDISTGAISDDDLDTLDVDLPFSPSSVKNIIVINANMEPLMPNLNSVSSEVYGRAFFKNNLLNIKYSYVGGSYNSLANPYLRKDIAGIDIKNSFRLLNNQISLSVGYNHYRDNLNKNKMGTTKSDGFFSCVSYYPGSEYFQGLSLSYTQSNRKNDIPDTLYQIEQLNNSIGFGTSYVIPFIRFARTGLSVNVLTSNSVDNKFKKFDVNSQNYQFSVNSDFNDLPLSSNLSFYYMKSEDNPVDTTRISSGYKGLHLREEYSFIPDKLKSYLGYNWTDSEGTSKYSKNGFTLGFSNKFNLFNSPTFVSGELSYIMFENKTVANNNYDKTEFRLKFSKKF